MDQESHFLEISVSNRDSARASIKDKGNHSIISSLQKHFAPRTDPSLFASIAPGL